MRRLKLTFVVLLLAFGVGLPPRLTAGAGGSPSTGGALGVGGSASVRRHVGPMVQGTSFLTYVSYLVLALVGFVMVGMQVDKTRSGKRRNHG
jgi:hypothetical protein